MCDILYKLLKLREKSIVKINVRLWIICILFWNDLLLPALLTMLISYFLKAVTTFFYPRARFFRRNQDWILKSKNRFCISFFFLLACVRACNDMEKIIMEKKKNRQRNYFYYPNTYFVVLKFSSGAILCTFRISKDFT